MKSFYYFTQNGNFLTVAFIKSAFRCALFVAYSKYGKKRRVIFLIIIIIIFCVWNGIRQNKLKKLAYFFKIFTQT